MNNLHIKLIRESFERVSAEELSDKFYSHLFSIQPAMRLVFPEHPFDQKRQLTEMLKSLIESLDDEVQLRAISESLGRRQALDGMRDEHYQTFGTALISALSESDDSGFTRETETAWKEFYELTSNEMKSGVRRLSENTAQIQKSTKQEKTMNIFTQAKAITTNLFLIVIFAIATFAQNETPSIAPPANDSFLNAETVSGMQVHIARTNVEATKEPGEPNHGNNTGGASVWFKWTAPMSRLMTFTTNRTSTNLDTIIHIYTGTSVNTLFSETFGQDINSPSNLKSYLRFEAQAGTTYYIAVEGAKYAATPVAQGLFTLDIHPAYPFQGNDFDEDGMTDLSVFRPVNGTWYVDGTSRSDTRQWGANGDIPLVRAATGSASTGYIVYRPTNSTFYLQSQTGQFGYFTFGSAGDIPITTNFFSSDGTDYAVFRPSTGTWYLNRFSSVEQYRFGLNGDIPVAGNYSPDHFADVAVFRPSNGTWYFMLRQSANQSTDTFRAIQFGIAGDKPVPADYDGDGLLDVAVYRPSTGVWWVLQSSNNQATAYKWGIAEDVPATGDYDGDGKYDYAVFRPSTGTWYIRRSGDNSAFIKQFGQSGDIPVTANRTF